MGGAPALRAVIFDLWDTLVLWNSEGLEDVYAQMAAHVGVDADDLTRAFRETHVDRAVGPLRENVSSVLSAVGASDEHVDVVVDLRRAFTRTVLVPRDGALETLDELARCGYKRGLISVCSGDVEDVWDDTVLAPHLDDVVLSCAVGLRKPDPAIYLLACERLGVEPADCLFVGDGANDELAGAERVGMRAVCVLPPGRREPLWAEARGWEPTIDELTDVLALVGA